MITDDIHGVDIGSDVWGEGQTTDIAEHMGPVVPGFTNIQLIGFKKKESSCGVYGDVCVIRVGQSFPRNRSYKGGGGSLSHTGRSL